MQTESNMAASLRRLGSSRKLTFCKIRGFYRTYLSEAYRCEPVWEESRQVESLTSVRADSFVVDLLEKFDKQRFLPALDVEIFATKLPELRNDAEHLASDIIYKFRHCESNWPIKDSINHAIIKSYIQKGWTDKLIEMIRNRNSYGIFPDEQASCILIDHLLKKKDYKNAVQIAYEVMLQEDFAHPIRNALSLVAAVKHVYNNDGLQRYEPPVVDPEEEIEYIPVKVVSNQYYDDHFDIVDEQFLLGKTLYYFAKEMPGLDETLSHSLQLLGLGMYNKFKVANQKLEEWGSDIDSSVVDKYLEYLTDAPVKPDEIPFKPPSERTLEDELELKRITENEKSTYLNDLEKHMEKHQYSSIDIEKEVEKYASLVIKNNEKKDINVLQEKYSEWQNSRQTRLQEQIQKFEVEQKKTEIMEKLHKIHEKEELLTYFEKRAEILLHKSLREKQDEIVDDGSAEEEYVEAPGERNVKKAVSKKKK